MDNKELRKASRRNLKRNYWACIAVCFLLLIFGVEYSTSDTVLGDRSDFGFDNQQQTTQTEQTVHRVKGSQIGKHLIDNAAGLFDNQQLQQATTGVMATIANDATKTAHALTFIADAVNKAVGKSPVAGFLLSLLGAIFSLAVYMFFQVQLKVGERRFFLENRIYHDTKATRIFYIYETTYVWNVAWIMLVRAVCWLLWMLTIAGGVMKFYEYRAIAYILAENPGISRKDCFALAKELTYGHKMEMFRFDIAYVLWFLLGSLSFGLLSIFYVNPFYRGGQAEFHVKLRELAKAASTEHIELLDDEALFLHQDEVRSTDLYPTIKIKAKHELAVPWDRHYSIVHIGLIFFSFAMIGWCWEVLYHFLLNGMLINRGSLWGPWIPIYGIGGACVVVFLKPLGKKPPLLAICTFFACGIIEYFTGWYFEVFKHIKYWDYTNYLFNLQGRVCLEGLIMFTVLASLGLYIIAPRFDDLFRKWPAGVKVPLLCVLAAAFIGDLSYTHFHPHTGKGITSQLPLDMMDTCTMDIDTEVSHVQSHVHIYI